jgi:hypothetical protein
MYARVTLVEIDTLRTSVDEATAVFVDEVLPTLRERPGFEGTLLLATPEGMGMVVTFWETEPAAAPDEAYSSTLERYVTMFRAPPGRESYRVTLADLPRAPQTASP